MENIFNIQTAFFKILDKGFKDEVCVFKILKGDIPLKYILIEGIEEQLEKGLYNHFKIYIKFICKNSDSIWLERTIQKAKIIIKKENLERELKVEIGGIGLNNCVLQNFSYGIEGKLVYDLWC